MTVSEQKRAAELEDMAFRNVSLSAPCSSPDLLLFLSFKALYAYAAYGKLSQDEGRELKQQILDSYEVRLHLERIYDQVNAVHMALAPLIEELRSIPDVEKYPTVCKFLHCTGGDAIWKKTKEGG